MTAHAITPVRSRQEWAEVINADWRKSIESVVQTGLDLEAAKSDLPQGHWELMIRNDLSFGPTTANALRRIAKHPVISNRHDRAEIPTSWTVLRELASLTESDFRDAQKRGLIGPRTNQWEAHAVSSAYRSNDVTPIGEGKKLSTLPPPESARKIARETNRLVAASDGNLYSGSTEEEGADYVRRREQTYRVIDAIQNIAACGVTPEQWLDEAKDHWLTRFNLHEIEAASNWLGELYAAYYLRKGIVDAE